jgi:hypothetical protein
LPEGAVEEIPAKLWRPSLGIGRKKQVEAADRKPWENPSPGKARGRGPKKANG